MIRRTWYLVRHGETEWNAAARMQGQLDSRLTPLGREHARRAARLLARLGVDSVMASPLGRVRETIAIMMAEVPLAAVAFDDRLKEWSAGEWSGERYADLADKWPADWAAWKADRYNYRSPGGENFVDLTNRARSFLADMPGGSEERIAIVAHGFINRALAGVLLSLLPADTMRIRQGNDAVIRIVERDCGPYVDHFVGGEGPRPDLPEDVEQPL